MTNNLIVSILLVNTALLVYAIHRKRLWDELLNDNLPDWIMPPEKRGKKHKGMVFPKNGMLRATRNAVLGPKGAVLNTPDVQEEEQEKDRKKRLFLAKAETNPLATLPDGLNPEDFN